MWVMTWTVGGKCSEVCWTTCRKSHSSGDVWRRSWDSQSNPMNGFEVGTLNSPSIGSRISTCWWMDGHRMGSHPGSTRCGVMDLDDIVGVPTMLGEV